MAKAKAKAKAKATNKKVEDDGLKAATNTEPTPGKVQDAGFVSTPDEQKVAKDDEIRRVGWEEYDVARRKQFEQAPRQAVQEYHGKTLDELNKFESEEVDAPDTSREHLSTARPNEVEKMQKTEADRKGDASTDPKASTK